MLPPRYYDSLLAKDANYLSDVVEFSRASKAVKLKEDNAPDRLGVKERVCKARIRTLSRSL